MTSTLDACKTAAIVSHVACVLDDHERPLLVRGGKEHQGRRCAVSYCFHQDSFPTYFRGKEKGSLQMCPCMYANTDQRVFAWSKLHLDMKTGWHKSISLVAFQNGFMFAGVGPLVIDAILRDFPTPLSLHRAYQKVMSEADTIGRDPSEAACGMLRGVHTTPGRCITLRQSALIFNALFEPGC